MRLAEGAVGVVGGALASRGPGVLRYSGQGLPERLAAREDTVGLALQALSDFRYERLAISVDKALAGPGSAILRVEGANPAVLEGYPFVFNIDLSTDFNRLVALILEGLGQSQAAGPIRRRAGALSGAKQTVWRLHWRCVAGTCMLPPARDVPTKVGDEK